MLAGAAAVFMTARASVEDVPGNHHQLQHLLVERPERYDTAGAADPGVAGGDDSVPLVPSPC